MMLWSVFLFWDRNTSWGLTIPYEVIETFWVWFYFIFQKIPCKRVGWIIKWMHTSLFDIWFRWWVVSCFRFHGLFQLHWTMMVTNLRTRSVLLFELINVLSSSIRQYPPTFRHISYTSLQAPVALAIKMVPNFFVVYSFINFFWYSFHQ